MTIVLAFDVGAGSCSAALTENGKVIGAMQGRYNRGDGEPLVRLIARLMRESQMTLNAVDWIAVNVGPGSFTGIRVAIAAAMGMAARDRKNIFGVPSLGAIAAGIPESARRDKCIYVAMPSGKGDYHVAIYDQDLQTVLPPERQQSLSMPRDIDAGRIVFAGGGAIDAQKYFSGGDVYADDSNAGILSPAIADFCASNLKMAHRYPPKPIYLRDADVTLAKG